MGLKNHLATMTVVHFLYWEVELLEQTLRAQFRYSEIIETVFPSQTHQENKICP
jgi:hypothetical protein